MSDSYLPDNAPRDILLSLEELAARKLPHAPTFRKAAAEIERLRQLLSDTNTYYAECIAEREDLKQEVAELTRDLKTAVMGDSAELQDVKRENEKLRKALKPFADKYCDETGIGYTSEEYRAAAAAIRESGDE